MIILATFNEVANGLNFSLVPHCNPSAHALSFIADFITDSEAGSNGSMSGLVGACGNAGGMIFAVVFRLHPAGKAFLICGAVITVSGHSRLELHYVYIRFLRL